MANFELGVEVDCPMPVAHGLLHGYDDTRSIRTASAIAAIVCQQAPGVVGSPTATDLAIFLTEAGAES